MLAHVTDISQNSTIFLNGPFWGQNGASKPLKRWFLRDKYLTINHLARSDPTRSPRNTWRSKTMELE